MRTLSNLFVTLALAASVGSAALTAQDSEKAEGSGKPAVAYYAVVLAKGPAYVEGGPHPGMSEHVAFMKAAHADGVIPLAGALFAKDNTRTDVSALLYFVRAGSLQEARDLVITEPLVQEKVVTIESIRVFIAGVGALD